jgi:hypothetical protein
LALSGSIPCQRFSATQPRLGIRPWLSWRASRRGMVPMSLSAMLRSSASVRFCEGAMWSVVLSSASDTDCARIRRIPAVIVVSRSESAVHATAATWPGGVTSARS